MNIEINGNRLAVEVLGPQDAPVLIAHHGAPGLGSRSEPRSSFGRFADTYRVVVFDARGSGESEGRPPFSHEQWAADVDALREWLGVEQIIMAGGSYGGFIALEYAIRYRHRVRALVLRDTSPDGTHKAASRQRALGSDRVDLDLESFDRINQGRVLDNNDLRECWKAILPLYDYDFDPVAAERKLDATTFRYQTHNYAFSVNMPAYDVKDQLPSITAPTLVTVGRHDWTTSLSVNETIARLIPRSEIVVFDRSGHSPQIEQADEWTATVREFLHRTCPVAEEPARG